jgi:hypothetical protein
VDATCDLDGKKEEEKRNIFHLLVGKWLWLRSKYRVDTERILEKCTSIYDGNDLYNTQSVDHLKTF